MPNEEAIPATAGADDGSWVLMTGGDQLHDWTSINVPNAGTLTVTGAWSRSPDACLVRIGGIDTNLQLGSNNVHVDDDSFIFYNLTEGDSSVSLVFNMT